MRRAVPWIASVALLVGIAVLVVTWKFSPDHHELYRAAATDFGVSMVDLAITVGVVDLLLKSYSERQRLQSITPRAIELIANLQEIRDLKVRYLSGTPSLGDLERYKRVVVAVRHSAYDLHILVSPADIILAGSLLRLSEQMRKHAEAVEDAILSIRNASADVPTWIARVNDGSEELLQAGTTLTSKLTRDYSLEGATT